MSVSITRWARAGAAACSAAQSCTTTPAGKPTAWLAGTVSCLIQFHWLSVVSPLGAALLPMYLGMFWGLFGAFAATFRSPEAPLRGAFCHAAVWAGLEWLRGWLFTGFGWNGLGYAVVR